MENVAYRCYVDTPIAKPCKEEQDGHDKSLVLVFDTETTTDEYQNLQYGSCGIWANGRLNRFIIFYNEDLLNENETAIIKTFASKHDYEVMNRSEFNDKVFFPYVYRSRAMCIGFNLPFDLSRLAIRFTYSRKYKDGFSFKLSEQPSNPSIVIKNLDSKRSFIGFTNPLRKKSDKIFKSYKGYFLDLKTFLFAITNNPYSLENAAIDFDCSCKKTHIDEYGKITEEALEYNVNDTLTTHDLYNKAVERYKLYGINKEHNRLYSPASIGKAYHNMMGIQPFMEKNQDFPKDVLGHLMNAYFGGRTEVKVRKEPIQVSYIDFTSMYPSLYTLIDADKFLKAEKIKCVNNTQEIQNLLDTITPEDVRDKALWKRLPCICRIKPYNDVLPVRANYGDSSTYNIGINFVKSDVDLWYTLADLIASKFLSGKTPIIEEAISFIPEGVQDGLTSIDIVDGITVNTDEDFIKKLIEERIRLKKEMKTKNGEERRQLDLKQNILKIIANSTSYGVFIEINTSDTEEQSVNVYGLDSFKATVNKAERQGRAFNPIIAVTITAGSRLILATAEALITKNNGTFAYCDTDSIFVSPDKVKMIQDFFKPLNPYNVKDLEMFKVEDDEDGKPLDNVWFYGISAKRYVLYDLHPETKEITIRKHSSHGLGHLLDIDEKQVWMDILTIHYNPEQKDAIAEKYSDKVAVSQLTISKYGILERFKNRNMGKPLNKQIKPFNFILVGTGHRENEDTKVKIIPMMPYISPKDKKFKQIPYMSFYDYRTDKYYDNQITLDTRSYWNPLDELFFGHNGYINHPESKSEGKIGLLVRKMITISKHSAIHIGKETNELEESQIMGVQAGNYLVYEDVDSKLKNRILNITKQEAQRFKISERTLRDWRAKIKNNKPLNLKKSLLSKLID